MCTPLDARNYDSINSNHTYSASTSSLNIPTSISSNRLPTTSPILLLNFPTANPAASPRNEPVEICRYSTGEKVVFCAVCACVCTVVYGSGLDPSPQDEKLDHDEVVSQRMGVNSKGRLVPRLYEARPIAVAEGTRRR